MTNLLTGFIALGVGSTIAYGAWLGGMAVSAHTRLTKLEDKQKGCKCGQDGK